MSARTPGPWEIHEPKKVPDHRPIDIGSADAYVGTIHGMTPEEIQANAAFIVTAVNGHDELVAALQEAASTLEHACPRGLPSDSSECGCRLCCVARQSRAALAKVQP